MKDEPAVRRYVTAATAQALRAGGQADATDTGLRTFNVVTLEWTDWVTVPDEDPRVDTFEYLTQGDAP